MRVMTIGLIGLIGGWLTVLAGASTHPQPATPQQQPAGVSSQRQVSAAPVPVSPQRAFLDRYCITCHNQKLRTAGLTLDTLDPAHVVADAAIWEKVIRKLRTRSMPPAGRPQPDEAASDAHASWLETQIDRAAAASPNPLRTQAFHRLNRYEYQNAIRDLVGLEIDVASMLPSDDGSYGFDNIAGALKFSPTLLDRYMSAARTISRAAVGSSAPLVTADTFRVRGDLSQDGHVDGLPFGTRGGTAIRHTFPQDAEYVVKVTLQSDVDDEIFGLDGEPHQLEVSVDGERVTLFTVGGRKPGTVTLTSDPAAANLEIRVPVKAGPRSVVVTFLKKTSAMSEKTLRRPFLRPHAENDYLMYEPYVATVTITGPFDASESTPAQETPSRRRIFVCHPTSRADEAGCAKRILSTLMRRAYRRPVTDAELQVVGAFYDDGLAKGGFEAGIEMALRRILASPEFLFRIERDPANLAPNTPYRLSDLELASRLSFFLWSSIPDDELLDVSVRGKLSNPMLLKQQVQRMLADKRSQALAINFAGQWLYFRNLPAVVRDYVRFPDFGDTLRQDFQRETELLFDSVLRENRRVSDLLTANYTFVNERLAKHYGIPGVYGSHFRRVTLTDDNRRGLLGQGSVLTTTSYADRTSPVLRGKWILENILNAPPPPPPPDVPALENTTPTGEVLSMRERMARHRANPVCASCHARMDPLGFALENFDAVGKWRRTEAGTPLDVSAVLPDGTTLEGPAGLRTMLMSRPQQFVTTATEKLLTYALGRGLEYSDAPTVRRIARDAAPTDYRLSSLVMGVVTSVPFQMRNSRP